MRKILFLWLILIFFLLSNNAFSENKIINLEVAYKTINFAGKKVQAIAVNNQIPAPTLHFKEGDHVVINVFNHIHVGTIIHWHGLLVPWQMDGVDGISQHAIAPNEMFRYHFTIKQSGTYWYHAHAGFQEQQGLYGAIVIDPKKSIYHPKKDFVMVLSDWSNTNPEKIFFNLKKDGDYYSPRFPLQPSLFKFIHDYRKANIQQKKLLLENYKMMQKMRMSIYDFSDVAYDAFLLNGKTNQNPWTAKVKVGDIVRLRFIDAAGSTNFHVKIPGHILKIIQVDGNDIHPIDSKKFFITPGETYDVLIKINNQNPVIIYAESANTLGHAIGALITQPNQCVDYQLVQPFPEPIPITQEMMDSMNAGINDASMAHRMPMSMNSHHMSSMHHTKKEIKNGTHMSMSAMNMSHHSYHSQQPQKDKNNSSSVNNTGKMSHNMNMSMPTMPSILGDHIELFTKSIANVKTTDTEYQNLIDIRETNNPHKPIAGVIRMELFGFMGRYIWMINGLPEYKAKPIVILPKKRYRIIFTNESMMHHPMHIHGHWFILRNGHGSHDPLLHTIDVAPGSTIVADIDADASGQWFFHCHHLYHMMAGMARVFQYQTIINIIKGTEKPKRYIASTGFYNRPIVRVDKDTPIIPALIMHPMGHPARFYMANFLDVAEDPWYNAQEISFKGMYGGDYNKLKLHAEDAKLEKGKITDLDLDIFYWHLLSQFWSIEGGANYVNQPAYHPYWQPGIGIVGLMPYFIDIELRTYFYSGSVKFDFELSRDTQITNNFFIRTSIESVFATKAVNSAPIGSGMNEMQYIIRPYYRVAPGWNVFAQYQYTKDYGLLAALDRLRNDSQNDNIFTIGLTWLF